MLRKLTLLLAVLVNPAIAQEHDQVIDAVVENHVLPGFAVFSEATKELENAAQLQCPENAVPLKAAYHAAFDAWLGVSHLRFGPLEEDNRGFALAFWPDTRGATPKALARMIAQEDPIVADAQDFTTVSVAARGFYALEYLLFDPALRAAGTEAYRCNLMRAIAVDIHSNAEWINREWLESFADIMRNAPAGPYQSDEEVLRAFFKSLSTGLEFAADTRIGRPMGSFDKPRPNRAEARRSQRSLRNVLLNLRALAQLTRHLSQGHPEVQDELDVLFERAILVGERLDDPVFAGVVEVQGRLRIEALQTAIQRIREIARVKLGGAYGISAGFNSLDGD